MTDVNSRVGGRYERGGVERDQTKMKEFSGGNDGCFLFFCENMIFI